MSLSFTFKLHKGGMPGEGTLLPEPGICENPDFSIRRDPVIAKAVKMADRYHNSDPLI